MEPQPDDVPPSPKKVKTPSSAAAAPSRPQTRPSSAVTPLSQEEKDRLFAKYGQLKPPTPDEVAAVAKDCKMQ